MGGEFLRSIALRCVGVARDCNEVETKRKLYDIAEELLRKSHEIDGTQAPTGAPRRSTERP